jgi:hypothetical protein
MWRSFSSGGEAAQDYPDQCASTSDLNVVMFAERDTPCWGWEAEIKADINPSYHPLPPFRCVRNGSQTRELSLRY